MLPFAELCVVVKNGVITAQGSPAQLVHLATDLQKNDEIYISELSGIDLTQDIFEEESIDEKKNHASAEGSGTTLVQEEEKATGSVKLSIYVKYFWASGGIIYLFFFVLSFLIVNAAQVGNDWWLKKWTDHSVEFLISPVLFSKAVSQNIAEIFKYKKGLYNEFASMNVLKRLKNDAVIQALNSIQDENSALYFVSIYALFGLLFMVANNIQLLTVLSGSYIGSKNIHERLLNSVLGAPLRFFEITRNFKIKP